MYVETPGRYEVRAFFFSDRNGSDDQAPAPLYRQFNILTTSSSPLRSNMSSLIEAPGRVEEATSAQETMPTYHLQRRIRRLVVCLTLLRKITNNKQLTTYSNGFLSANATPRRRRRCHGRR
jgi:hypothetical protein